MDKDRLEVWRQVIENAIEITVEGMSDQDKLHQLRNLACTLNFMIEQLQKCVDYGDKRGEISGPQ